MFFAGFDLFWSFGPMFLDFGDTFGYVKLY